MKRKVCSAALVAMAVIAVLLWQTTKPAEATAEETSFVTTEATTADAVLAAIDTSSYIKLGADLELTLSGQTLIVDLAGNDLTVNGSGTVKAFDSANDTYDHLMCGILTAEETVTFDTVYEAPNGGRYVALTEGSYTTFHRLDMTIKTVNLRMSSAGLYYKALYQCDRQIEQKVVAYGVVVSLEDMPGADFKTTDSDAYTVCTDTFVSGAAASSGTVVNILKEDITPAENLKRSRMPIYANAYIDLGDGPIVADTANVGKKAGTCASFAQVLAALDASYGNLRTSVQGQLNSFSAKWKALDLDFGFTNIGIEKNIIDNSDLVFDEGTTNAYCPVCEEKVTWTALTKPTNAKDGYHYYLPADVEFAKEGSAFIKAPAADQTACLHLNGHNITHTEGGVISGNSGVLNVMGNGVVTGYNNKGTLGAAIRLNNKNPNSRLNLYGGTYKKTEAAKSGWAVIMVGDAGGTLNVYEGATVGNGSGTAIQTSQNHYIDCHVTLNGCVINGNVVMEEPSDDYPNKTNIDMIDCTVNGTVSVTPRHTLNLSGDVYIKRLKVAEDAYITTKSLTSGASIAVDADGIFSTDSISVKDYLNCFTAYTKGEKITVKDNALHCSQDYTSDLSFEDGTTDAWCPVCKKTVTWTELTGTDSVALEANSHYYLADDVIYSGDATNFISSSSTTKASCIHLNGHNITAENSRVIFASSSKVNFMGSGVVKGQFNSSGNNGSTIHTNNKSAVINLYSGTYAQGSGVDSAQYTVNAQGAGGTINIYEDALVKGDVNGNALRAGNASAANLSVNVYGAKIEGNVLAVGAKTDTYTASLLLDGAKISGTVDIDGKNNVTVIHDTVIGLLNMEDTTKVTLDRLTDGANIVVQNAGTFTDANTKASEYVKYFVPAFINDTIYVQDNMLTQKYNYVSQILPDQNNEAFCPACRAVVKWQVFTDDTQEHEFTDGGHFYLTEDLNYTGTEVYMKTGAKDTTTCIHLNGHNITSSNNYVFFVSYGFLNVMGEGTVMGKTDTTNRGCVLYTNNKTETNGANFFSGTYTKVNPTSKNAVISLGANGGNIAVYEDAVIDAAGSGMAVYAGTATNRTGTFRLVNATIKGNVVIPGAAGTTYQSVFESTNGTITGEVKIGGASQVSFSGKTKIGKLVVAEGNIVNFTDMLPESSVKVSAEGVFSSYMKDAYQWVEYFSTDDTGDWVIVRDRTFYQGAKSDVTAAEQSDIEALLAAYGDRVARFGETHNHSTDGPEADGYYTIAEWKAEIANLGLDFATIVDHRQSLHMYEEAWDNSIFIGGAETGSAMSDLGVENNHCHYNMIFSDVEAFEELITTFVQFEDHSVYGEGYTFSSVNITYEQVQQLADRIWELGGFFVHVHPKFPNYIQSDDPLDYYFGEHTGIEILLTDSKNFDCNNTYNKAAFQLWLDLLELGKQVYATYGNDNHLLPNLNAVTNIYTNEKSADEYVQRLRSGDFAPGWVGLRMMVGDATMGGTTNFEGQRVVFSVGEMMEVKYDATHEYAVRLYDDGGLLMESTVDPSQMNYYAIDADSEAKFYRVEVYDYTIDQYVCVGNPIWNG